MVPWAHPSPIIPNGISIASAVFAGFTIVTDQQTDYRQTDHVTPSVTIGRICVVLRCGLKTKSRFGRLLYDVRLGNGPGPILIATRPTRAATVPDTHGTG